MAAGKRGKLKEELTGIHRNCVWIDQHCEKCLNILDPPYAELINMFHAIQKISKQLDEIAQSVYGSI